MDARIDAEAGSFVNRLVVYFFPAIDHFSGQLPRSIGMQRLSVTFLRIDLS
jgi:hypothetical protein